MKRSTLLSLAIVASLSPTLARSQVAGTTLVGVAEAELRRVAVGWSAKREVLGQPVFNDLNERVGTVDDILSSRPTSRSLTRSSTPAGSSASPNMMLRSRSGD